MKIAISTESTSDLSKDLLLENNIFVIRYPVLLGENVYSDGENITPEQIFEFVDETGQLPKTSAINEFSFVDYFNDILNQGYDGIVHISLSSEISSTCKNAMNVAENKFKGKVKIINSLSLSTGCGLLVLYACELQKQGLGLEEIYEKVNSRVPYVQTSFVVNTTDYLHKGGRCSGLAKFAANLLKLKPQIIMENGVMHPGKKYRGRNSAVVANYCEDILEEYNNPDLSVAFVTHTVASEEMVSAAKEALEKRGFKRIIDTTAGCTITSHCGPKTLGILYINDGGKVEK
ncbi:MAG: DegV family protein [Bacilli bacterium]